MNTTLAVVLGLAAGFTLAVVLMNGSECCAALGKAGLAKYGVPDLGHDLDALLGGAASALGLV